MSYLPEEDQDYLRSKGLPFELKAESVGGTLIRAIVLPDFQFHGKLYSDKAGRRSQCSSCTLMFLVPQGYSTTKLDCFYTMPRLTRADGSPPQSTGDADLFGSKWQFWSRHLADGEWRAGIDGIQTFLGYVRAELRAA